MRPQTPPLLLPLFLGSGCAALIYEVVWLQMLQLVIGSSAISLAVLLGTFMGGMCLGSLALPRWLPPHIRPLQAYAVLELGMAVAGIGVLLAVPALGGVYTSLAGHGLPGILLRALLCAICLLAPTMAMGATLPAIARGLEATPRGMSWLGFFYGGNTVGAVVGCLLAGFYLLRVHDSTIATAVAVTLNLLVALLALGLDRLERRSAAPRAADGRTSLLAVADPHLAAGGDPEAGLLAAGRNRQPGHAPSSDHEPAAFETPDAPPGACGETVPFNRGLAEPSSHSTLPLVVLALSGFSALAAEVVWTRLLSLAIGATVYTFSLILAVFLAGLAVGSGVGARLTRTCASPRRLLAACQLLQVGALCWAAHVLAVSLPTATNAVAPSPATRFLVDLLRCAWAVFPSACLWGATFPVALACLAGPGRDPSHLVGRAYAANTLGAIGGAVLAGLLLVPGLGSHQTQVLLGALSLGGALLLARPRRALEWIALPAAAFAAVLLLRQLPPIPWQLVAYGRHTGTTEYGARALYLGEGMNASVAVSETLDGARYFHVSGKTEASSLVKDMRLQRMLGHLPALLHPQPRSVLIVGCGAGVTAGTFVLHPAVERIVICDIEPLIPRVVARHFREENHNVLGDPRVEVVHDDARHYIATTRERFDVITSDPIHPWVKGSAVLYSREYFELCRARLRPGGIVSQWVPLYESDRAVVQSELATFFSVFPEGTLWGNDDGGFGYDTVVIGQERPLHVDVAALEERLERSDHVRIRVALGELGLGSAVALLSTYAGSAAGLKPWLATAEINRDRTLRLQYLAGLRLDSTAGSDAYLEILRHRTIPAGLFLGPEVRLAELRRAMGAVPSAP